ncbi:Bug family tripartite tricarboxylate transporter substrate binding protein [Ramlibacter albus]|uniref:Tripartite tricarboxylate transporter substrate binding protein n=1 Tax=Ramlibacter albus TaxID=2079448 RepID=A0A923S7G3_9BURK|nr:tripartite tricarboxylate transporter substrate binding protein [Ramlibacter albus]MBC5767107.1 tripartite tricarboxylate transporter substrate binding protein [Ramlibacter albus]
MKKTLLLLSLVASLVVPAAAVAQDYPTKPVTLVVAYPPGGGADAIGRLIGEKLQESMGKAFVIDNRPGFSGNIGAQYVAKSAPDGYTLLVAPWTTYAINTVLYGTQRVGYALDKDFVGISTLGFQPMALMINPAVPANTVQELIAYAKSKPGALTFGSTGPGSLEHIAGEMFKRSAGISMVHVPYRGSGPAMTDLIGGQIQVYFATAPTVVQHMNTGRVKTLMVTTPERNPALANLPTPKEVGLQNLEVRSTYGLLAPTGTPPAIVKKLNDELVKILGNADVKAKFRSLGVDAVSSTSEDMTQRLSADIPRWGAIIKAADIKAEN